MNSFNMSPATASPFSMSNFVVSTAASLVANAISALVVRYARSGLPIPLAVHRQELRNKLKEMPFIYKDIDTEVLCDFVDVNIQSLDLQGLREVSDSSLLSLEQRLQNRRKVLLLGNAGIGKTTYFRHTILCLLGGMKTGFLHRMEEVVPFYVPLKAVDNTKPWPIAHYVLQNNLYLAGDRGRRRLLRLAKKRRTMLFLDGYDEIFLDLGSREQINFIRKDLNCLMSKNVPTSGIDDKYFQTLYRELAECRVWLSSRREFYDSNSLDLSRSYISRQEPRECIGLALLGVMNSRMLLVQKIFDKYRSRANKYRELLSEELFLQQIDRSCSTELRELSQNPLFLTVMCYVYVTKALETNNPIVEWPAGASELISRCIDLLLRDIDAYKARDLPPAQKLALFRRRNVYEKEKRSFLPYFAWGVLKDRQNLFDIAYLNSKVVEFFSNQADGDEKWEIIETIRRNPMSPDSLGQQLVNQGIFVLVEKSGLAAKYDFAHRQFKEVLATQYLDVHEMEADILQLLDHEDYSEFVYTLMQGSRYREAIFRRLLENILHSPRQDYYGRLVSGCALLPLVGYDRSGPIEGFFIRVLAGNRCPRITRRFIECVPQSEALENAAIGALETGVSEKCRWKISLAAELLNRLRASRLLTELGRHLYRVAAINEILVDFLYFIYQLKSKSVSAHILKFDFPALLATGFAVAGGMREEAEIADMVAKGIRLLDLRTRTILLTALYTVSKSFFAQLANYPWSSAEIEANFHLVFFAKSEPDAWHKMLGKKENCYVVTRFSIESLSQIEAGKGHLREVGTVFVLETGDEEKKIKKLRTVGAEDISKLTVVQRGDIQEIGEAIRMEREAWGDRPIGFEFYID